MISGLIWLVLGIIMARIYWGMNLKGQFSEQVRYNGAGYGVKEILKMVGMVLAGPAAIVIFLLAVFYWKK